MSFHGFIQYLRNSERAKWLRRNHPNAYLLLSLIAERARRTNDLDDGLEIGEAQIGDHEEAGLTRQKHKTAIRCLERNHFIKIVETQKKPRTFFNVPSMGRSITTKATTKATTNGTVVKLIDTSVWNINEEKENKQVTTKATTDITTSSTTEQPPSNHEQERKKERIAKEQGGSISKDISPPPPTKPAIAGRGEGAGKRKEAYRHPFPIGEDALRFYEKSVTHGMAISADQFQKALDGGYSLKQVETGFKETVTYHKYLVSKNSRIGNPTGFFNSKLIELYGKMNSTKILNIKDLHELKA